MANEYYLKGSGELNVAVFEEAPNGTMIVSAAISVISMTYKQKMTKEDARDFYRELRDKRGWAKVKPDGSKDFFNKFSHRSIWNTYA